MRVFYKFDGEPVIFIQAGGKTNIVRGFLPYFFVDDPKEGEQTRIRAFNSPQLLNRIVLTNPKDVPRERAKFQMTWEADVPFARRFTIDNEIEPPDEFYFSVLDVETENKAILQQTRREGSAKLLSWAYYNSKRDEYETFVVGEDGGEEEAFKRLFRLLVVDRPDVLTGWNIKGFDLPYLYYRAVRLGIDDVPFRLIEEEPFSEIFEIIDMKDVFQYVTKQNIMSLEGACEYLGIEGKIKIDRDRIDELSLSELRKYNKRDVELVKEINEKIHGFEILLELQRITHVEKLENCLKNMVMIDAILLKEARRLGYALPTSVSKQKKKFEGAYVLEPASGIFKDVYVFDFASLYPSLIVSFNLSPDTLCLEKKKEDIIDPGNGYYFRRDGIGFVPYVIEKFLEQRLKFKRRYKETGDFEYYLKQLVLKYLINSFYGVMGNTAFRLYRREVAETVTFLARSLLKEVRRFVEENSLGRVIAGDTDSIFVANLKIDVEQFLERVNEFVRDFCKKRNAFREDVMKIEFDKKFDKLMLFGVKKKYCGLIGKEIFVRGVSSVRGDTPRFLKKLEKELIEIILLSENKEEVISFLKRKMKEFKEADLLEIAIPKGLRKELDDYKTSSIHVKALKRSGIDVRAGEKVYYVFIGDEAYAFLERYVPDVLRKKENINYKKLWDSYYANKIALLLKPLVGENMAKSLSVFSHDTQADLRRWFNVQHQGV